MEKRRPSCCLSHIYDDLLSEAITEATSSGESSVKKGSMSLIYRFFLVVLVLIVCSCVSSPQPMSFKDFVLFLLFCDCCIVIIHYLNKSSRDSVGYQLFLFVRSRTRRICGLAAI